MRFLVWKQGFYSSAVARFHEPRCCISLVFLFDNQPTNPEFLLFSEKCTINKKQTAWTHALFCHTFEFLGMRITALLRWIYCSSSVCVSGIFTTTTSSVPICEQRRRSPLLRTNVFQGCPIKLSFEFEGCCCSLKNLLKFGIVREIIFPLDLKFLSKIDGGCKLLTQLEKKVKAVKMLCS